MDIQSFIRERLRETEQESWMTELDLRILEAHSDDGPPCGTILDMAARWADHPDYKEAICQRPTGSSGTT
jgi:hypothetical protein